MEENQYAQLVDTVRAEAQKIGGKLASYVRSVEFLYEVFSNKPDLTRTKRDGLIHAYIDSYASQCNSRADELNAGGEIDGFSFAKAGRMLGVGGLVHLLRTGKQPRPIELKAEKVDTDKCFRDFCGALEKLEAGELTGIGCSLIIPRRPNNKFIEKD